VPLLGAVLRRRRGTVVSDGFGTRYGARDTFMHSLTRILKRNFQILSVNFGLFIKGILDFRDDFLFVVQRSQILEYLFRALNSIRDFKR
jgi:hypothetical protein